MSYNAVIRDGPSSEASILGRVLLADLKDVPSFWRVKYRGSPLDRSTELGEIMCGPHEPIQIIKIHKSDAIMIFVKLVNEKSIIVHLSRWDVVETLKSEIERLESIPMDQQRLIFSGLQLEDGRTLNDYGVENESTVSLVLRLPGGKVKESSFYTVDMQARQITRQSKGPAKYNWAGCYKGLNFWGFCPNETCVSNTIDEKPKRVYVNARYGLVEMTGDKNQFECPACPKDLNQVGTFCPDNFLVNSARSLFRYKKSGVGQPFREILMESFGRKEYKTFDDMEGMAQYDCIQIITVGKESSPFQCLKCDLSCVAPGDSPKSEYFLHCGHVYHRSCAPRNQECMICKTKMVGSVKEVTNNIETFTEFMATNDHGFSHRRNKKDKDSKLAYLKIFWNYQ